VKKRKAKNQTEYYDYEDIPVRIYFDPSDGLYHCKNWADIPWPIGKAISLAGRVSKKQHDNVVKAYRDYFWHKIITEDQLNIVISKNFGTQFYK
jgi:hypothetical protein